MPVAPTIVSTWNPPPPRQVRRFHDLSVPGIDRPGSGDSDRVDPIASDPRSGEQLLRIFDDPGDIAPRIAAGFDGPLEALYDLALRVAESERELGATDVDSEQQQEKTLCISVGSEDFPRI